MQGYLVDHHSLVTPIDWKLTGHRRSHFTLPHVSHHSLVTPIDWKLRLLSSLRQTIVVSVTTRW